MNDEILRQREILKSARRHLHKDPNVLATGIGYKVVRGVKTSDLSIVCSVKEKLPESQLMKKHFIASDFEGIPTDVVQTGIIRAFSPDTRRIRPAPGGVSIGHKDITAGTMGCLVKIKDEIFILSNNHVLANCNNAQRGDPVLQPGPYDGGLMPDDRIADLYQFVPINFSGSAEPCSGSHRITRCLNFLSGLVCSNTRFQAVGLKVPENLVDAAIARPFNENDVTNEILDIGNISDVVSGELGMAIKKRGRTTGLTKGEIIQVDVTVTVSYGDGKSAVFTDQLMAGGMSQGGDSGSAVLSSDNRLTGLLFAGSDTTTVINRIENVFSAFGVTDVLNC